MDLSKKILKDEFFKLGLSNEQIKIINNYIDNFNDEKHLKIIDNDLSIILGAISAEGKIDLSLAKKVKQSIVLNYS